MRTDERIFARLKNAAAPLARFLHRRQCLANFLEFSPYDRSSGHKAIVGSIAVGTSGWTYRDWRGRFYPERLPQRDWLAYYVARFDTVELNITTYRLPKERDLARWVAVPDDFTYSVKLSRLITHRRRPGTPQTFVDNYMRAIAPLEPRISNVLAQFPPWFARDEDALRGFLEALPPHHRYVVEFRHPSWYVSSVYELLRERRISLCLHDLAGSVTPRVITGPVLYIRLHGPVRAYAGSYRRVRLEHWARDVRELAPQVEATFVYFNNDEKAFAPRNAATLREMLADVAPLTPRLSRANSKLDFTQAEWRAAPLGRKISA